MIARCHLLGRDTPDAQRAAKEALRFLSKPCKADPEKVVSIGKYLNAAFRRAQEVFPFVRDDGIRSVCILRLGLGRVSGDTQVNEWRSSW